MKTREGNDVWPADAPIRETIRGNSTSICADCAHCADYCRDMQKGVTRHSYTQVDWCSGFERIQEPHNTHILEE